MLHKSIQRLFNHYCLTFRSTINKLINNLINLLIVRGKDRLSELLSIVYSRIKLAKIREMLKCNLHNYQ